MPRLAMALYEKKTAIISFGLIQQIYALLITTQNTHMNAENAVQKPYIGNNKITQ